jgi:hypothetical protein
MGLEATHSPQIDGTRVKKEAGEFKPKVRNFVFQFHKQKGHPATG